MKKFIVFLLPLLFGGLLLAQAPPPVTPNIGMYIPEHGSLNWDTWYNANWNTLDAFGVLGMANHAGAHVKTASSKNDTAMILTIGAGGNSATYIFATPYQFSPACVATGSLLSLGTLVVSETATAITVTSQTAAPAGGAFVFAICFGAPN